MISTLEIVPAHADLIPFGRFCEGCKSGIFTQDDGYGYLATSMMFYRERPVDCDELAEDTGRAMFPHTHVAWFNK